MCASVGVNHPLNLGSWPLLLIDQPRRVGRTFLWYGILARVIVASLECTVIQPCSTLDVWWETHTWLDMSALVTVCME